jgi:hypothetical protein
MISILMALNFAISLEMNDIYLRIMNIYVYVNIVL